MASPLLTRLQAKLFSFSIQAEPLKMARSVLLTSLAITGLVLSLRQLGLLQGQELSSYDQLIQLQPDEGEDPRLLVVGVNETDLQTLEEWPLSDRTVARLLQKIETYKPRAIGLDIARDIPIEPGHQTLLDQLTRNPNIVVVCKASGKNDPGFAPPKGLTNIKQDRVGSADLVVDAGGTLRRSLLMVQPPSANGLAKIRPHYCSDPNRTLISLSLQTVLKYLNAEKIPVGFTPAQEMKLGNKIFPRFYGNMGSYRNADDDGYQVMLRYRSESKAAKQVSALDILQNKVPPELIRARIVFVGYTTPLVKDDFYTPYSGRKQDRQKMPGVIVHAQSASQLLAATLDRRPLIWVWPWFAEVAWILAWACIGGVLASYLHHPLRFVLVIGTVTGVIFGICYLVFLQGGWIPLVPAVMAFIGSAIGEVLFDRFNNSAYGQAMYKKVRTFLKLEVDIDDEKVEKQVAEITESDYFKDLQDTVKVLRSQPAAAPTSTSFSPSNASALNLGDADDYELDFVNQLKQESQSFKPVSQSEATVSSEDYELDFINQLKQESYSLKPTQNAEAPAVTVSNNDSSGFLQLDFLDQLTVTNPSPSTAVDLFGVRSTSLKAIPFTTEPGATSQEKPTSEEASNREDDDFDFLADLKQESQRLKEGKSS